MNAPLFPPPTTLAAATPDAMGHLGWILICGIIGLVAVIRVLRKPTDTWKHGTLTKIGWVLAVLYLALPLGGYPIPLGAIAAIWRTRRPETTPPAQLPYADGGTWESK